MAIQRVVLGLDFSTSSIDAAHWGSRFIAPHAELILVHAIDVAPPPPFGGPSVPSGEVIEGAARDHAVARLHDIALFLSEHPVRTEIRVGKPHVVLSEVAADTGADMIVVGPHGERHHAWQPLGTTAERLARTSPVPVLVVKTPHGGAPRNILVPVDDLRVTPTLLDWTSVLAETLDAEVTLLHVLSNAAYSHVASMSHAEMPHDDTAAERLAEDSLRDEGVRWLGKIARTGIQRERVSAAVTYGDAGDAIVTMAETIGVDLIVLGRRGRGQVIPSLLGSTVRTALNGAPCPVLVVTEPLASAS
jgi:nucleotide-binding universal stress UspA family protein